MLSAKLRQVQLYSSGKKLSPSNLATYTLSTLSLLTAHSLYGRERSRAIFRREKEQCRRVDTKLRH